jgi:urea-proton symporter
MLFMAIVSTGAAESIAVASLVAYDVYREYMNPQASGEQILYVSRLAVVVFGLFMGAFSILLKEIGLNLGWVYLFMGIWIGSAVCPLWNMMTWKKASGTGAVIAAWAGLVLALTGWLCAAKVNGGEITADTLGENVVMLSGNLIAIISSGIIHYVYSVYVDPQDYDFDDLDKNIRLVEQDLRGLTDAEKDPVALEHAEKWISRRGYALTVLLIFVWPVLSVPAGVFSKSYFAFWVLVAIAWGFGAAIVITVLPLAESSEEITTVLTGVFNFITRKSTHEVEDFENVKKVDVSFEDKIIDKKEEPTTPQDDDEMKA